MSTDAPDRPLRICLFSYQFLPMVGGLEQVSMTLATAWAADGQAVTLVTVTPPPAGEAAVDYDRSFPFPVVRLPPGPAGRRAFAAILANVDLVCSNGVSLTYWPTWVRLRVPIVFVHQLYLGVEPWRHAGGPTVQLRRWARLAGRRWLVGRAAGNVFISQFVRGVVGTKGGVVIHNPIAADFQPMPDVPRSADIGFFGRMVGEKGVDHLLHAIAVCHDRGHRFTVDLYGDGPDLPAFRAAAERLGLGDRVRWPGVARGPALVAAINAVGVVVVPSTWWEPMGIIAVEAMACGRCVIGSAGGGLGEVLAGVCPTYPNGDTAALADLLVRLVPDPVARASFEAAALRRSGDFQLDVIARRYIDYFRGVLRRRR